MQTLNSIIVDDENLALTLLEDYVSKVPGLSLKAKCKNAMEAISALQENRIELMFLDIQMPDLTGMELLRTLKEKPMVILTTAYTEFAIESYELNVIDYLLKPFSFERFIQAVNKASEQFRLKSKILNSKQPMAVIERTEKNHIFVKSDYKSIKVKFEEILYIEGLREYVSIYAGDKRIITLDSLKNFEKLLESHNFIRTHKSYIVNIDKIEAVVGNCVEINKKLIPIGKNYRQQVMLILA